MSLQDLFANHFEDFDEEKIDYSQVPIRMFKSSILERFTHVHPVMVLILFLPAVAYGLYASVRQLSAAEAVWQIPAAFAAGVLVWTLMEYLVHRFFFHFTPVSVWGKRMVFFFHGVHHVQPHIKTRLVMPPGASIPGGLIFLVLFRGIFDGLGLPELLGGFMAGFLLGYIGYDLLHYAEHHLPMKGPVLKFLKRHHMEHHYKTPRARFGVSTSLWDDVFHTEPAQTAAR